MSLQSRKQLFSKSVTYIPISWCLNLYLATLKLQLFKGIHIPDQRFVPSLFNFLHAVIANFYQHPENLFISL